MLDAVDCLQFWQLEFTIMLIPCRELDIAHEGGGLKM